MLRESADPAALDQACSAIEAIAKADDYLDANVNIPIIFQQLSQTLIRLAADTSIADAADFPVRRPPSHAAEFLLVC